MANKKRKFCYLSTQNSCKILAQKVLKAILSFAVLKANKNVIIEK